MTERLGCPLTRCPPPLPAAHLTLTMKVSPWGPRGLALTLMVPGPLPTPAPAGCPPPTTPCLGFPIKSAWFHKVPAGPGSWLGRGWVSF